MIRRISADITRDEMNVFKLSALVACLLLCPGLSADSLPDKPEPLTPEHHRVDREFVAEASAFAISWTVDAISTGESHLRDPNCVEVGGIFNGSRNTAKVMTAWAAIDISAGIAAYEWKKHVHNRYLHPLWRLPMLIGAGGHIRATLANEKLK